MATAAITAHDIVSRTYDAAAVNAVCNHPDVLPGVGLGHGAVDVTGLIADTRNVFFLGEHGGAMFHRTGPGVYAAHDFFVPEGRGPWALAASRFMLDAMFRDYGARLIWAEAPIANKPCRLFNRWLGFKSEGLTTCPVSGEVETFVMEAPSCR